MNSTVHANNRAKGVLILGESLTQGLENTTLYEEKMYSVNFTATRKNFSLILHYNGDNSYLFGNGTKIIKFKAKDSEIVASPVSLGNISEDFSVANMKKTKNGLHGSADYRVTAVDDTLNIHKYLMKENGI